MGFGQIGLGLFDDHAGLCEAFGGLRRDCGDFRIDWGDAEIGRIGHAQRLLPRPRGGEERGRRRGDRQRVGGEFAAHRVEQQRDVLDVARHRAVDAEIAVDLRRRRVRDPAEARAQPDDAAEARRVAQRAAHVGALGQPCGAGCERRRGAAGRAGRRARQVPRIARRPEHLVEGVGAGAEFRGVGFGVDHGAIGFEVLDHQVGAGRDVVLVDRRALGGEHAGDRGEVLDRQRQAGQQAAFGRRLLHQLGGVAAGAVEAQRGQRVDGAVDLGDPLLQHVEHLERRHLAGFELAHHCTSGFLYQRLICRHSVTPLS